MFSAAKHIYAQIIDDEQGVTLVPRVHHGQGLQGYGGNVEPQLQGRQAHRRTRLEKGITEVVFDRGGYVYHGRVKALAEGAREGGLKL